MGNDKEWILLTTDNQPEEDELVWLRVQNTSYVALGCRCYLKNEGWFWAKSNGIIYGKNGNITSECEIVDDDTFTHFCRLPKLS